MEPILALDRSLRRISEDGHLHVDRSNISKSVVNPYFGKEIPDHDRLGLDPKRKYWLWRHPDELKRGAATFNGKPILADHIPVTSTKHRSDLVVGSTGTDARYDHPYLKNSLHIWDQGAIDAINNGDQRELSCAYHYDADMRPGKTPEGVPFDGIMRNIRANHVALVSDGRAGADVMVADAMPAALRTTRHAILALGRDAAFSRKEGSMPSPMKLTPTAVYAKGALMAYLRPRLAMDARGAVDYDKLVGGLTAKNFAARSTMVKNAVVAATKGRLAQDADLEDLGNLIDALKGGVGGEVPPEVIDQDPTADPDVPGNPPDVNPDDMVALIKKYLEEEGVGPEIISNLDAFLAAAPQGSGDNSGAMPPPPPGMAAADESDDDEETEEERLKKLNADEEDAEGMPKNAAEDEIVPQEQKNLVTREAMDKAIRMAQDGAIKNQRAIREAERFVRPWVGELAMDAATPADVYRATLKALGVKGCGTMHRDALRPVLEAQPKPARAADRRQATTIAQDQKAAGGSFAERFPEAGRITIQ